MRAVTAARLGGPEQGATFLDKETGQESHIFPIWQKEDHSCHPFKRSVQKYLVQRPPQDDEDEEGDMEIAEHQVAFFTQEYPAFWTPNIHIPIDIFYLSLERSRQPSPFLLQVFHDYLIVRVQCGLTMIEAESHYGVIEATWSQKLDCNTVTTIQVLVPAIEECTYEETVGLITLQFVDDKLIGPPYLMRPHVGYSELFSINMSRIGGPR